MSISLSPVERETVFQIDEESLEWNIYTCQRRMMTKLNNAGWKPYWTDEEDDKLLAAKYKLPFNAITIRSQNALNKKKRSGRKLSPEHIAKMQAARNK